MRTLIMVLVFAVTVNVLNQIAKYNRSIWNTVIVFTLGWVFANPIAEKLDVGTRGDFNFDVRIPPRRRHVRFHLRFRVPRLAVAFVVYFIVISGVTALGDFLTNTVLRGFALLISDQYITAASFLAPFLVLLDLYYRNRSRPER